MNQFRSLFRSPIGLIFAVLVALLAGCGSGGLDPLLGTPDVDVTLPPDVGVTPPPGTGIAPTIAATLPLARTPVVAGVATNSAVFATFSKPMAPATLTPKSFTLNCPADAPIAASVAYDAGAQTATLTPEAELPPNTLCAATVTTAAQDTAGLALASNLVWGFMTAPAADLIPPTVTIVAPADGATSVVNNTQVSASFSEDMDPATINASSFTVANTALGTAVAGTVIYSATSRTAVFSPSTPDTLPDNTQFTATIGTAAKDLAGNALASSHVWVFTTAALADTTRPRVILTGPAPDASDVSNNTSITATFSEDMDPSTLSGTSFVVTNTALATPVEGTVSYWVAARTATFTPSTATLADNSPFTATITTAATDLAGNPLTGNTGSLPDAGDHVWTFATAAAPDVTAPTVIAVDPVQGTHAMCLTKTISATFSEPMDPSSIDDTTFRVTDEWSNPIAGTVTYDAQSRIASFVPSARLYEDTGLEATIESGDAGVKDAAGNALVDSESWSFRTGYEPCSTVVDLGVAGLFAAFGATGVHNEVTDDWRLQSSTIRGNAGTAAECTLVTGFKDANRRMYLPLPPLPGYVDGSVYCGPSWPGSPEFLAVAAMAANDARAAYDALAAKPDGIGMGAGQLGGLTLPPGVYTATGGTFNITSGDLTLDAQGDPTATWVFQSAGLTVGQERSVILLDGARAKNVFWQVGGSVYLEEYSVTKGIIIAKDGIIFSKRDTGDSFNTALFGRAFSLDGSVTLFGAYIDSTGDGW